METEKISNANLIVKIISIVFILLLLCLLFFGLFKLMNNKDDSMKVKFSSPDLKIFGETVVNGIINDIEDITANITIIGIRNYTFLDSEEKLVNTGESILVHFVGIGDSSEWKISFLLINSSLSLKMRCLDGRTNSNEPFAKEKCFWEANEGEIEV